MTTGLLALELVYRSNSRLFRKVLGQDENLRIVGSDDQNVAEKKRSSFAFLVRPTLSHFAKVDLLSPQYVPLLQETCFGFRCD